MLLPPPFIQRLKELLPPEEHEVFLHTCTEPLPRTVRFAEGFKIPRNWHIKRIPEIPEAGFLTRDDQAEMPLGKTLPHFTGQCYVASLSSLLAATVLDAQPEEKILDLCAAPGSKSSFISARMENTGLLVANEPDGKRLRKLTHNLNRMGCENTVVCQYDGTKLPQILGQEFDRILLDSPCSSEGSGRKKADFFTRYWSEKNIYDSAKLQRKLIDSAWQMLTPGGEMVYSTCTSAPEENELVVQYLMEQYPGTVEMLPVELGTIPHHTGVTEWDGQKILPEISTNVCRLYPHLRSDTWNSEIFFISRLRKTEGLKLTPPQGFSPQQPGKILGKNQLAEVSAGLAKTWGFPRDVLKGKALLQNADGNIFLTTPRTAQFGVRLPSRNVGILLADKQGNPGTEFAMHYGMQATQNVYQLTNTERDRWLAGYDIPLPNEHPAGTILFVRDEHYCLGWGKVIGKKLKNKLPRGIIMT